MTEEEVLEKAGYNPAREKFKHVLGKVLKWGLIIGLGGAALVTAGGALLGGGLIGSLPFGLPAMGLGLLTEGGRSLVGSGMGVIFRHALPYMLTLGGGVGLISGLMGKDEAEMNARDEILDNALRAQQRDGRQRSFFAGMDRSQGADYAMSAPNIGGLGQGRPAQRGI